MAVDNPNIVDFVSISPQGNITMTISDHLDWDVDNEHLLILQNKINAYINFIETGQLVKEYPDAQGRKIIFNIIAKCVPTETACNYLKKVESLLESCGYGYAFKHVKDH